MLRLLASLIPQHSFAVSCIMQYVLFPTFDGCWLVLICRYRKLWNSWMAVYIPHIHPCLQTNSDAHKHTIIIIIIIQHRCSSLSHAQCAHFFTRTRIASSGEDDRVHFVAVPYSTYILAYLIGRVWWWCLVASSVAISSPISIQRSAIVRDCSALTDSLRCFSFFRSCRRRRRRRVSSSCSLLFFPSFAVYTHTRKVSRNYRRHTITERKMLSPYDLDELTDDGADMDYYYDPHRQRYCYTVSARWHRRLPLREGLLHFHSVWYWICVVVRATCGLLA